MAALSGRNREIVRTLVQSAPDGVVARLQQALAETGDDAILGEVRQLVEAEVRDRELRDRVLAPLAPLCVGDGSDPDRLTFPVQILRLIWRALKTAAPQEMAEVQSAATAYELAIASQKRPEDPAAAYDALLAKCAEALRAPASREFQTIADLGDAARTSGAATLAACLDIAPVVRQAMERLPAWIGHPSDEVTAAARVAFKDAVQIAEDAGPRYFEMLAAHLNPPWKVLRVISAVMERPTERYLAESELQGFAERTTSDIDRALAAISHLDLDSGPSLARAVGHGVGEINNQIYELEHYFELDPTYGWGKHSLEQKNALAGAVESRLKDAERYALEALPSEVSTASKFRRSSPSLEEPPLATIVKRASAALAFSQAVRPFADHGGYSSASRKLQEKISTYLDRYVEEVLETVRAGRCEPTVAHAYLLVAADFAAFVRDEAAADLIRRRAEAVRPPESAPSVPD